MSARSILLMCACGLMLSAELAVADGGIERLNQWLARTKTLQAGFVQTTYDSKSQVIEESKGVLIAKRPGKFRWEYRTPSVQSLVASDDTIWIYDLDLAQVTIKHIDYGNGDAPIALLYGDQPLSAQYQLRDLGKREKLEWVELKPKNDNSSLTAIYLGMSEDALEVMELRDHFSQATQIQFNGFKTNQKISDQLFTFKIPKGVDVIDDR